MSSHEYYYTLDRSAWLVDALGNIDKPDKPDYRDKRSQRILTTAELPRVLMGGTSAMRKAGRRFLPQMPKETNGTYEARLLRTVLLNKFRDAVRGHSARIFSELVTIKGDNVPSGVWEFVKDVDGQGTTLHNFAKSLYEDAKVTGISYVYVDSPPRIPGETLADSKRLMPYWVHVRQEDFLGFKSELDGGRERVVQFRKQEWFEIPDGRFGSDRVKQVRIFVPSGQVVLRQTDKQKDIWNLIDQIETDFEDIPIYPYYTQKCGFFDAEPPLLDLAELNAAHWQSSSDQRNILHFARVPILVVTSGTDIMDIAISSAIAVQLSDGDMKFVEHDGKAIDAGRRDLLDLEDQMDVTANEPLKTRPGNPTATARALDEVEMHSELQKEAVDLQIILDNLLKKVAEISGWSTEGWQVHVNTEASLILFNETKVQALVAMRAAGDLSRRTLLERSQQVGILDKDLDLDEEEKRIASETPAAPTRIEQNMGSTAATNPLTGNQKPAAQPPQPKE